MSPSLLSIRQALKSDMREVLNLVEALADYERAADQVNLSLEDYETYFDQGRFSCLLAEMSDQVVGMALYYSTFSTWRGPILYLEDLMVYTDHQGQGIGRQLFDALVEEGRAQGCVLMKWQVLDWNLPAIGFYEKLGASIDKTWYNGVLRLD